VLMVGARLDWTFRFGTEFAREVKFIQIDIHGPEIGRNRAPEIGIEGDAKAALRGIIAAMSFESRANLKAQLGPWHAVLNEERRKRRKAFAARMDQSSLPMSPYRMLKEIRDFLPRDAISILDGNVFMAAAEQVLPSYRPAARFTAASDGCMGVGIPFSMGAKLADPERLVVAICGDTAFGFSAMEMETAVRHSVPVIVVVVNNDGSSGALTQSALFPASDQRVTMYQADIHYENIARAFGGYAEHVERPEQIRPALERAQASGKAACINIRVDPHAPYPSE